MKKSFPPLGLVCAVIGAQWGDEGKGKVIDLLAEHFGVIARACGGANAGHTILVDGKKHVFRLLPSGCLHSGKSVVLGGGMVMHLPTLLEEIASLEGAGVSILDRLSLYPNAHIVFEYHKDIDAVLEERRMGQKGEGIGTTRKGIGPAYMEKAARSGLRLESLRWDVQLVKKELEDRRRAVVQMYGVRIDVDRECEEFARAQKLLAPHVVMNGPELLRDFLEREESILIEGAQATLLDIDQGTYPFVTSSCTTAAGALQGLGLAPRTLTSCIGVAKAYCTRVGSGAFATEDTAEAGNRLRERGGEYGSVTGRPRRCGWLHLPDLRYSAIVNGFDCWNITKLDVLDTEEVIPVGTGMDDRGNVLYEKLPGWKTSTRGITAFEKLPKEAKHYIEFIEKQTNLSARLIGTGQGREEMIVK
ncbi:adenylosuccinate synthase [Candidatus Peregrinibacteria bacterium]|nr:adenylosuccinate synthase [Candidatus Peregrinibacteria bacterium]MBI3816664.1 adenylosuccinate synthase [Candidatus Peregrinibacteria bacterium]